MASFVLIWVFLLATYGLENCTATFFYDSGVALVGTGGTTEAEQGNACAISGDNSRILDKFVSFYVSLRGTNMRKESQIFIEWKRTSST